MSAKITYVLNLLHAAVLQPDTWQKLEKCDVLLVRHDCHCGYEYQGKAYAHLIDSLADLCVKNGLLTGTVASPYSKLTGVYAYNFPVSYNKYAAIRALIRMVIRLFKNSENSNEWLYNRITLLWCRIFDQAKPRFVIGMQPDQSLCRAGKIKGLPVYDLQHGVIDDENFWYGEKYRIGTPPQDLPSGFLCWDEQSAAALRKWAPQKGIDVRVVGNPWFARFLFKDPSDFLVQEASKDGKIFHNDRPTILVSLQWGMRYYYNQKEFNGVMVDALEKVILETADSYNWLLRLHPVQIREQEKESAQHYLKRSFGHLASVEWRACSTLPLPVVLEQVDLHITDMSTIVVEAAWMGIYSALLNILICPGGKLEKIYSYERNLGLASVLPQDVNIIKQWIKENISKQRLQSPLMDQRTRMQEFIDEMKFK